jgi:hypothetical protein
MLLFIIRKIYLFESFELQKLDIIRLVIFNLMKSGTG